MTEPTSYRITLVEDNPGDVCLIQEALQTQSLTYELDHFADGELFLKAIDSPQHTAPDLVMLDLNLPKLDGIEILRRLRQHPRGSNFTVLVVTSSCAEQDQRRAMEAGANEFLRKATDLEEFLETVGQSVRRALLGKAFRSSP